MAGLLLLSRSASSKGSRKLFSRSISHSLLEVRESGHLEESFGHSCQEQPTAPEVTAGSCNSPQHQQIRYAGLFEGNLASGLRRNICLLDGADKPFNRSAEPPSDFGSYQRTEILFTDDGSVLKASHTTLVDSRMFLEKCLAAINADQLIFSLMATSHVHEQVVRTSFQSFGMVDPNHFFMVHAPMATILQNWNYLCPFVPSFVAKELSSLTSQVGEEEHSQEIVQEAEAGEKQLSEREDALETLVDDDSIRIAKILKEDRLESSIFDSLSSFRVSIRRSIMQSMPSAPNDSVAHQGGEEFGIQVRMVALDQVDCANSSIEWLLKDAPGSKSFLGLVCKYGPNNCPCLIQLSLHQRCVLISVPSRPSTRHPKMLRTILSDENIIKVGAEIHKDALALFHYLGLVTNRCIKITHMSTGQRRKKGVLSIFRDLFNWGWMEKKKVVASDWGLYLSLDQGHKEK